MYERAREEDKHEAYVCITVTIFTYLQTTERVCMCVCMCVRASRTLTVKNGLFHHCTNIFLLENVPSFGSQYADGRFSFCAPTVSAQISS